MTSYERKGRGLAEAQIDGLLAPLVRWWNNRGAKQATIAGRGPLVMLCQDPAQLPVLSTLALNFGVCTRWFCSVPGETWPNRNFLHAATSDGETNIAPRFYDNPTVFELLERAGKSWHIYYDDTPQVWAFINLWQDDERHANWYQFPDFFDHVAQDKLPTYSFIEPNHRPPVHTPDRGPIIGQPGVSNSQHPGNNPVTNDAYDGYVATGDTDFNRGEQLIAAIYEALRKNPALFEKTVLLITYDEHGGLYDHVPPPTDAAAVGAKSSLITSLFRFLYRPRAASFDFKTLGPRVPAVVVSPLIPPGTVSTDVRDHASVPATLRALFAPDQPPLTARDGAANGFHSLLSLSAPRRDDLPDLSRYLAAPGPPPAAAVAAVAAVGPAPAGPAPAAPVAPAGAAPAPAVPVAADNGVFPDHFDDMVKLSDMVGQRLKAKGASPVQIPPTAPPAERMVQASQAFAEIANAIREPGPPS